MSFEASGPRQAIYLRSWLRGLSDLSHFDLQCRLDGSIVRFLRDPGA